MGLRDRLRRLVKSAGKPSATLKSKRAGLRGSSCTEPEPPPALEELAPGSVLGDLDGRIVHRKERSS